MQKIGYQQFLMLHFMMAAEGDQLFKLVLLQGKSVAGQTFVKCVFYV